MKNNLLLYFALLVTVIRNSESDDKIVTESGQDVPWYRYEYDELTKDIQDQQIKMFKNTGEKYRVSSLVLFSKKAFPIVTSYGKPVVGGSEFGKGRVIVLPNWSYYDDSKNDPSMSKFLENAIKWLAQKNDNIKVGINGISQAGPIAGVHLDSSDLVYGFNADVFVSTFYVNHDANAIIKFVEDGGGLMLAGQVWSWGNPDLVTLQFPANKILLPMGLVSYGNDWMGEQTINPGIPAVESSLFQALNILELDVDNENAQATVINLAEAIIQPVLTDIEILKPIFDKSILVLKKVIEAKLRFSVLYYKLVDLLFPAITDMREDHIHTYYDIDLFPYDFVSDSPVKSREIEIDGTIVCGTPVMVSTGLYVKAGTVVDVKLPEGAVQETKVRIGCHTDYILSTPETQERSPGVVLDFKVRSKDLKVASPYGGLLFIVTMKNSGIFNITVEGAYDSQQYVHGKTSPEEWRSTIRNFPAPWGELIVPGKIAFSFPSEDMRSLEDPESLANFYERGMDEVSKFAGFSETLCQQRIVFDVQTSGGDWHSGYPIVTTIDNSPDHLNMTFLNYSGSERLYSEIGSNHHWATGMHHPDIRNITNEWWSIVVNKRIVPKENAKNVFPEDKALDRLRSWVAEGKNKSGNWFAYLTMFYFAAENFGWETYTETMKKLHILKPAPKADDYFNRWVFYYVEVVKFNLCPYFDLFGFYHDQNTKKLCQRNPDLQNSPLAEDFELLETILGKPNATKSTLHLI